MPDEREIDPPTTPDRERTSRSFSARVFITLLMITGFLAVWKAREILLVALLGILFGVALTPVIDWMEKRRIRRGFGVLIVLLAGAGIVWVTYLLVGPSIGDQVAAVRKQLPEAIEKTYSSVRAAIPGAELPSEATVKDEVSETFSGGEELQKLGARMIGVFKGIIGVIGGFLLVLSITAYTAAQPRLYSRSILMLFSSERRPQASRALEAVSETWQHWVRAQLISMTVIGILTTVALWIIGIEAALALGVLAGISEFIPVFGPLLSAIPAIGIAFLDGPEKALYVLVAYLVIQQIESNIVTPLVMKKVVEVPPLATILAGSLLVIFAGFAGLLMAVPLLAAIVAVARTFLGDEFLS